MTALTYALVTPSFWKDFDRCAMLVESIERYMAPHVRHYLVVDRRDVALFRPLASTRTELMVVEDIIPRWIFRIPKVPRFWGSLKTRPIKNWIVQQIVKLSVPGILREDVLLYADSDMFFLEPIDPRSFERDGRIPLLAEPGQRGLIEFNDRWQGVASKLLGLPVETGCDMNYIGNLVWWRRQNVEKMLRRVEQTTGRDWVRSIASLSEFSEYILYGVHAERVLGEASGHWGDPLVRNLNYWKTTPLDAAALRALRDEKQLHHHSVMISAKSRTPVSTIRDVFMPS